MIFFMLTDIFHLNLAMHLSLRQTCYSGSCCGHLDTKEHDLKHATHAHSITDNASCPLQSNKCNYDRAFTGKYNYD